MRWQYLWILAIALAGLTASRQASAQPSRALKGVVVNVSTGEPLNAVTIELKDNSMPALVTSSDGVFTFAKVPVGDVTVVARAEGYLPVELPLRAGRVATTVVIPMVPAPPPPLPPTRSLVVLIRDANTGRGLASASVALGAGAPVLTDPDGLVVLAGVDAQDVTLQISAAGYQPSTATVAATAATTKVDLLPVPPEPAVAPAPEPEPAPAPTLTDEELAALSEAQAETEADEVIIVTGSAIERKELTTVAPVSVVGRADLDAAGLATIGGVLQNLPSQANGINAQVNNGGDGSTRINLRGLGSRRTLTLINGRRVVPGGTGADSSVDINAIPLAMVERVEVLKDGASALYGSDAVGGVVNVITRRDLEGTEVALYTGSSQRGDGVSYDASFATGVSSKKGHLMFSAGFQNQDSVLAADRDFAKSDESFNYASKTESVGGSTTIPEGRVDTSRIDANGDGRGDGGYDLCGLDSGGDPIQFCTRNGPSGFRPYDPVADSYNFQPENYLYTPSERYNVFAVGGYQLHPRVRAFFEGSFLNRKSDQRLAPDTFVNDAPISATSIYNPLGVTLLGYRRRLLEFGPRRGLQNIDTFRLVTGFDGELPESLHGWKWELSYNFGRTEGVQRGVGNLIISRLANAVGPSFFDANGVPTCGTPDNPIPDCVPLNILAGAGARVITQEMIDYVTYTGVSNGYNRQQTLLAQAHGQLVKLPGGGDIAAAVGFDHRREAGGFTPDPLTATGDTTANAAQPTEGGYNVTEGFVELSAVPVIGKGLAQWVELSAAARAFRYDNFGSGLTWKLGGLFRTVGGVSLRGTYSTAFRAPSVSELFSGKADGEPLTNDPCDTEPPGSDGPIVLDPMVAAQCAKQGVPEGSVFGTAQQRSVVGGNPELSEETADVLTVGAVFEPPVVKGLSFTVDYFHIEIEKAIQALGAAAILANCYRRGIDSYCDQVKRNPTLGYSIDFIDDPLTNVGGNSTSGVDFAVEYDHRQPFGRFRHRLEGTYLTEFLLDNTDQIFDGLGVYDLGVYPKLKSNFTTTWGYGGAGAGANVRYVAGYDECQNNDCNSFKGAARDSNKRSVDDNITVDIFGSYAFENPVGETSVSFGINNVLDQEPPLVYSGLADSDPGTYDYMGRFFYARVAQKF